MIAAFFRSLIWALPLTMLLVHWGIRWFVFRKAGEKGWKSLIPFYGTYISYKIVWDGRIYWTLLLALGIGFTISFPCFLIGYTFGLFMSVLCNTVPLGAFIVAGILRRYKMARSFGMDEKHFIGLCLFNSLFSCIAAFGDYEYQGVQYKDGIGIPAALANIGKKPAAPVQPQQPVYYQQPYQARGYQPVQPQQPIARRSDRTNPPASNGFQD